MFYVWEPFGLILTHNIMSVITAIISFIYLCINISCIKNKDILMNLLKNCLLIVLMTAFFWMPLLETKFSTDYSVYQKDTMSTIESFNNNKLDFFLII